MFLVLSREEGTDVTLVNSGDNVGIGTESQFKRKLTRPRCSGTPVVTTVVFHNDLPYDGIYRSKRWWFLSPPA